MLSDTLRLTIGWALPWLLGASLMMAFRSRSRSEDPAGVIAWTIGCGWFVGAFALTLWMRVLSLAGIPFSLFSIGMPIAASAIAVAAFAMRRASRAEWMNTLRDGWREFRGVQLNGWKRALWLALLIWLALRSLILLLDVVTMPLYPWDAWIQWATKARVWFELGRIVLFERTDEWFNAGGAAWFDAAPNYPATVPLWQVWTDVALSRWDDSLMNVPWWLLALAFLFAVYGVLRRTGYDTLAALVATWLVTSLPLASVHVALAGYADLPMATYYALAAIAVWNWTRERTAANAALAGFLAVACMTVKTPGIVWVLTLAPAVVLAVFPRRGKRILAVSLGFAIALLLVLARTDAVVLGYRLHLEFAPPWIGMFESLFLLGNWHLLWYGALAVAVVGWREMLSPKLVPLSATIASGLVFLFVVFAFTNARAWVTDQTTINRATLHLAPLLSIWALIVFEAWLCRLRNVTPVPATASA